MPFAKVRDIDVYYEVSGKGPRLMYISGTGGDLRKKPNVFDSALAEHFEILAYDQRGLGQTDKPDVSYTMADYADDADGLLEAVGWERCSVVGISFGGMVAPELTLRHPNRVDKIVLCCTSSGGIGNASYPLHNLWDLSFHDYTKRVMELSDNRVTAEWQASHPEQSKSMLDQRLATAAIGADEPGHDIGARRQIEPRHFKIR